MLFNSKGFSVYEMKSYFSLLCVLTSTLCSTETVFNIVIFLLLGLSFNKTTVCENTYCKIEATEHHHIQELGMLM